MTYIAGRDGVGVPFSLTTVPIRAHMRDNRENTSSTQPISKFLFQQIVGSPGVGLFSQVIDPDSGGQADLYTILTLDQT